AYGNLDETQRQRLQTLLTTEQYQEVRPLMITTYERGLQEGLQKGIEKGLQEGKLEGLQEGKLEGLQEGKLEGLREMVLLQLEAKFGALTPAIQQRVATVTLEQLRQLVVDLVQSRSLQALHLQD